MSEPTLCPWIADGTLIRAQNNVLVAAAEFADVDVETAQANAVLIAAAPGLLAACEALVLAWDRGLDALTEAVEVAAARDAIAKAKEKP